VFLDTDVDGSGRLLGDSVAETPVREGRRKASPRLRSAESPLSLRIPPVVLGESVVESPMASSVRLPPTPVAERSTSGVPQDETGPLSATELKSNELAATEPPDEPEDMHVRDEDGTEFHIPDKALKEGLVRWNKVGGTRLVRAESEMPPEGKGSKRMYKMSKMFSTSKVLAGTGLVLGYLLLTNQTPRACCPKRGRRWRIPTSWITSDRTSCTGRMNRSLSPCAAENHTDVSDASSRVGFADTV
jgi:hypothetical protein